MKLIKEKKDKRVTLLLPGTLFKEVALKAAEKVMSINGYIRTRLNDLSKEGKL